MQVFITGTDTDIGKTIVSAWLCLHTRYDYFKPIQTGAIHGTDSELVQKLTNVITHTEAFLYNEALSPHLAARLKNEIIDIKNPYTKVSKHNY